MRGFLGTLIECSISMTVLIFGFMAVTPWLSKRYAAKWIYYAWAIIVAGLIFPLRFHAGAALIPVNIIPPAEVRQAMQEYGDTAGTQALIPAGKESLGLTAASSWEQAAGGLWLAGVVIFAAYYGLKHYRFLKLVKRWRQPADPQMYEILLNIKSDLGITKQVGLYIAPCVTSPMLTGFVNPALLLPAQHFSADELPYILKHELIHFKRKDLWYKSLVFVAAAMHWFNPAVYLMAKSIAKQCEISCDAEVVKGADDAARQQYSETILRVIRNQSKLQTMFSTNFHGGLKEMKQRIFGIMDIAKKKNGIVVLGLILLGTIGSGIAFPANQEAAAGSYAEEAVASAREQAGTANWMDSEETAQSYAEYEKYGLTFDKKIHRFYYHGKLVRSFADELDGNGTYRFFTFPDGAFDLEAVRNADGRIEKLVEISDKN
ncbi:MAG: M56 family metallopeptidase [Paenibacillus macerans]|uniref:Peptidase M56 n=1 Tax=Paenibacillus macerans TaxID=44252 RepID=A0A090Z944_PAEMA|nr:M56 family metallopeptidase [Paenibacillus macerans]KFN00861.1 blaR1 peptidase M56 family protein [Paenibacillus macerans]MBS5911909.1 M56 family metallopeptidase [Paenibacillus macerans]MCY7561928.1 M56 family metallopeptidase [Paenibacillus macerans]MDU7474259.1 M56 family metallopeptidase [Paenibacillus macerans]MEC0153664.1 M56 family metallopeptidase [Paenibacillus macerans]